MITEEKRQKVADYIIDNELHSLIDNAVSHKITSQSLVEHYKSGKSEIVITLGSSCNRIKVEIEGEEVTIDKSGATSLLDEIHLSIQKAVKL